MSRGALNSEAPANEGKVDSQFITIKTEDPLYQTYLNGRFSASKRALPVIRFSKTKPTIQTTFRIVDVDSLKIPAKAQVIFLALRPKYLILSLGPILALGFETVKPGRWTDLWTFGFGTLSFSFFYFSFFLLNDYLDHVSGQDRFFSGRGSQIIQKGWEPAYRIQQWAFVNFILGLVAAFAIVDFTSSRFWVSGALILFSFALFASLRNLRLIGLAEVIIFLCFGPLLIFSFQSVILGDSLTVGQLLMSGFFGAQAVIFFHFRQLENIFDGSQLGVRNLVTTLGFDRAKLLVAIEILASTTWYLFFAWWSQAHLVLYFAILVVIPRLRDLSDLSSPLSSLVRGMSQRWLVSHLVLLVLLLISIGLSQ